MKKHLFFLLVSMFVITNIEAVCSVPGYGVNSERDKIVSRQVSPVISNSVPENESVVFVSKSVLPIITLTCTAFESRIAQLNWTTDNPVLVGIYFVERDVASSGTWDVLAQLPYNAVLQYDDTISDPYCAATDFSYRIRFEITLTAETAYSNPCDQVLWDQTKPENVQDVIVSIKPTSTISYPVIYWKQVTGDELFGYEIDRFNGFNWPTIITVPPDSSSYLDETVTDGCAQSYAYVIVTVDKCMNRSAPSYIPVKQTLKLNLPPIDDCERLAKLSWNPYNAMPGGLGGYRIYREVDGVSIIIATITDTAYTDAYQFENGKNYIYYVQAFSASGSGVSSSCREGSTFNGANIPDSVYITSLSVESDSYIRINYSSSPEKTIKKLFLERSDDGITFQVIDSLTNPGDFVPRESYFEDATVNVDGWIFYYRLVSNDYCGTNELISNVSRNILLLCSSSATQNTVDWNSYESWIKGVEGYKVYRTVDGQPAAGELMGSLTPLTLSYPDVLTGVDPTKQVCYWVVAAENPGNPYLSNATSTSNTCCIIKGATLFMPNAFRPAGINNRFRPVATFVDPLKFKMILFSRWGQQFFETTDMVNGWDGTINEQAAPQGLYAYVITYTSYGGQEYTQRGTVYVVE